MLGRFITSTIHTPQLHTYDQHRHILVPPNKDPERSKRAMIKHVYDGVFTMKNRPLIFTTLQVSSTTRIRGEDPSS